MTVIIFYNDFSFTKKMAENLPICFRIPQLFVKKISIQVLRKHYHQIISHKSRYMENVESLTNLCIDG